MTQNFLIGTGRSSRKRLTISACIFACAACTLHRLVEARVGHLDRVRIRVVELVLGAVVVWNVRRRSLGRVAEVAMSL